MKSGVFRQHKRLASNFRVFWVWTFPQLFGFSYLLTIRKCPEWNSAVAFHSVRYKIHLPSALFQLLQYFLFKISYFSLRYKNLFTWNVLSSFERHSKYYSVKWRSFDVSTPREEHMYNRMHLLREMYVENIGSLRLVSRNGTSEALETSDGR